LLSKVELANCAIIILSMYNDDPNDRGVAGVDFFRFNSDRKIVEHWDVLQEVPDPAKAANTNGMF
jgi:predicted SnoaL-like aldol condensation-catalyzing enzyme